MFVLKEKNYSCNQIDQELLLVVITGNVNNIFHFQKCIDQEGAETGLLPFAT